MSNVTLIQARDALNRWLAADKAVATGQSYQLGNKQLTRTHAAEIRANINYWNKQISIINGQGSIRVRRVRFRDD